MKIFCKYDELVDPSKLKEHSKNRNKHGQDQIDRLVELFNYHGIRHPIICDADDRSTIISGRGRQLAAIKGKIKEFPVVYQKFDSEEQRYAFIQADNAIALWSELDLSGINTDLSDLGPDFDINMLGIKDFTLDVADKEGLTDPDEVPEEVEPVCKLGQIWKLGDHRLMCGDSTDLATVEKLMDGNKADITFTSPPYNAGKTPKENGKYLNDTDDKDQSDYCDFLASFTSNANIVSDFVFVNIQSLSGNKLALIDYLYKLKDIYADTIIWDKLYSQPAMANNVLNSQFEYVHIFSKKANRAIGSKDFRGTISNVFQLSSKKDKEFASVHKATFPVSFAEYFIDNFSNKTVYEPFGGSGTTMIACEKTNQKCFMMELDPHYCDVIIARWEKFTGKKAELIDGTT